MVMKGQRAEDLFWGQAFPLHFIIIKGGYSIIQKPRQMGNCTGLSKKQPKHLRSSLPCPLPQDDTLTCGICSSPFDSKEKSPMMLCANQHNTCKNCTQQLTKTLPSFCPFCRQPINNKTIAVNRILMEIITSKQTTSKGNIPETDQDKVERILRQARQSGIQKVIYFIEVGADLANIRELHLWNLSLKNIIDLSLFTGLKTLDLHKNHIEKIQNLEKLTSLVFLNLGYNQISTIQNLQTLTKLQFLDICHNKITKIDNLSTLKSLTTLNLSHNSIQIVQNLYQLSKLSILYLTNNPIQFVRNCGSIRALQHRGVLLQISNTQ